VCRNGLETKRKIATPEQLQAIVALQSIKRRLMPLGIARVCLFLSSELGYAMAGQTLNAEALAPAWRDIQTRAPVKLRTIENKRHYEAMVKFLTGWLMKLATRNHIR
jgi:hypothetical protein